MDGWKIESVEYKKGKQVGDLIFLLGNAICVNDEGVEHFVIGGVVFSDML